MQLAGVVGVGVERGYLEGDVLAVYADALPIERGGELQRDAGERDLAVVADGDEGADGDLLLGGAEMNVQAVGSEADGLALARLLTRSVSRLPWMVARRAGWSG